MLAATAITNLVLALMIQEPHITLNTDGVFGVSVETQYIHSVTINELNSLVSTQCPICKRATSRKPIDFLGAKPCTIKFEYDELRRCGFCDNCWPWFYLNVDILDTNEWHHVIDAINYEKVWGYNQAPYTEGGSK